MIAPEHHSLQGDREGLIHSRAVPEYSAGYCIGWVSPRFGK